MTDISDFLKENPSMKTKWAKCVERGEYYISLTVGDSYVVQPPHKNDIPGWIRIIDDTEEDYLFPLEWFEIYWE